MEDDHQQPAAQGSTGGRVTGGSGPGGVHPPVIQLLRNQVARRIANADLLPMCELVRWLHAGSGAPFVECVKWVLGEVARLVGRQGLYLIPPGDWPQVCHEGADMLSNPNLDDEFLKLFPGDCTDAAWDRLRDRKQVSGFDWLLNVWCGATGMAQLQWAYGSQFAIERDVARAVFGYVDPLNATVSPPTTDAGSSEASDKPDGVVQPKGGAWPHKPGAKWTDAERDAMFEMRGKSVMTDKAIARVVGVKSDQRISQQIGSKDANERRDWKGCPRGWRPSEELLERCFGTVRHRIK